MSQINDADFTPTAPNFKQLVYMSFQGLTNFPYIEEDFDALTNYELLSKVVEYLNQVIANNNEQNDLMTGLYNAYVELQNYVNNYFDNLDVQEEINNKLDEMAIDGSLYALIETFVSPYLTAQDNKINQIENKVNSLYSGAPLVASSTAGMTDTTRVYVNTTDGKWYYYDGDSWEIGGTYQSSELANGSIDILKLDSLLQGNFITQYGTELERGDAYTGYYNYEGTLTESADYRNFHIALTLGKTYAIQYYNRYTMAGLVIKDSSNNIVYKSSDASAGSSYNFGVIYFKCKENNLTAYISEIASTSSTYERELLCRCYSLDKIYNALKYSSNVKLIKTIDNHYAAVTADNNWVGNIPANTSADCYVYALEKGKTYNITGYNWSGMSAIVIIDFNNTILYQSSDSNIGNTHVSVSKTYESNSNGYILLSKYKTSDDYPVTINAVNTTIDVETTNKFTNLKIGADGDSISAGVNGNLSYITQIANDNNCTLQNLSVGGATIATGTQSSGQNRHWISTSVTNLNNDCELIMVSGGVNDYWNSVPLGTFNPSYTTETSEIDTDTFYGALDYMFRILLDKFKTQKIVFVTYHKINTIYYSKNSLNLTFKDYQDAIYKVCDKYSIPVIDINKNGRLNTAISYYASNYTTGDGVHPNTTGYKKFYNQLVINGLNNLL